MTVRGVAEWQKVREDTHRDPAGQQTLTSLKNLPDESRSHSDEEPAERCFDISIETDERQPVTLHPLFPYTSSPVCPTVYPRSTPTSRPSMLLVLTCCEVIATCCLWNSSPQIPAKSIRV